MVNVSNPIVSIAISTYNWSSALRCAIRSVLLQTVQDFEVLIVGDGCTDDSAAVVAEFDDSRLQWHNLAQNHGSQWAVNNFANQNAAADWIAYLGHDDIWYPTHLEAILRTAKNTSAEIITSVMILFGPQGSGIRGVAGLFPTRNFSSRDFVPPSAIAHKRSIFRDVKWRDPQTIVTPVDVAFLTEAAASGTIASTGELTSFKFNAAYRRDAYKVRPIAEQERLLKLIESGVDFRQEVYLETVEAFVAGKAHHVQMPTTKGVSVGWFFRKNRQQKGLDSRYDPAILKRVDRRQRFDLADQDMPFEWHELENHPKYGTFRWTGPSPRATIDLPIVFDRDLAVRIHVLSALNDETINTLKLSIHEQDIAYRLDRLREGTFFIFAQLDHAAVAKPKRDFGITLEIANTLRPLDLRLSKDVELLVPTTKLESRWLGLAINWVELEPLSSLDSGERALESDKAECALAPDAQYSDQCADGSRSRPPSPPEPLVQHSKFQFRFEDEGIDLLGVGWSSPETWGTWSDGPRAALRLPVGAKRGKWKANITFRTFGKEGREVTVYVTTSTAPERSEWLIPANRIVQEELSVESDSSDVILYFAFPGLTSPRELGISDDSRYLGVGLISLELMTWEKSLQSDLLAKNEMIAAREAELERTNEALKASEARENSLQSDLLAKNEMIAAREAELERANEALKASETRANSLQSDLLAENEMIAAREAELERANEALKASEARANSLQSDLLAENEMIAAREAELERANEALKASEARANSLQSDLLAKNEMIAAIYASTSWRITGPLRVARSAWRRFARMSG